ncbi:hypothetical protein NKH48_34405 [Mesorhizobium sp. M1233]|uniref:hypothetical protein n=1 Tax=Mesorhizobium sp. M1233 TaxID=2957072 RepID=UPI00333A54AE
MTERVAMMKRRPMDLLPGTVLRKTAVRHPLVPSKLRSCASPSATAILRPKCTVCDADDLETRPYVFRGHFSGHSPVGEETKFAFSTLSRAHFGSTFLHALSKKEQGLFEKFVSLADTLFLDKTLKKGDRLFPHGQGSHGQGANPTINEWLDGLVCYEVRLTRGNVTSIHQLAVLRRGAIYQRLQFPQLVLHRHSAGEVSRC